MERKSLIRWVLQYNAIETLKFYFYKVFAKIYHTLYLRRSTEYPAEISKYIISALSENAFYSNIRHLESIDTEGISFNAISLAGSEYSLTNRNIYWQKHFSDPEDQESLHRWNWSVAKLSSISLDEKSRLMVWVQQENWIDNFQSEISENATAKQLRWESYTVGERISNTVIFYYLVLGGLPSLKISDAIQDQVRYIIDNLEYFGKNTGNHVVNNARAIYLAGVVYNCEEWKMLSLKIIEREVPVLVTKDGFLREGSSHYQFLFTHWMLEVYYFSTTASDNKMINFLSPYLNLLIQQCHFFLIEDKKSKKWSMPLFGDISPDYPPEWLIPLPWSKLATCFIEAPSKELVNTGGNWNSLWDGTDVIKNSEEAPLKLKKSDSLIYPESGWFRVEQGEFTLFYRMDKESVPDYVGHHHQDLYHFCLYKNGAPIFVDSGRKSYDQAYGSWGQFGLSPQAHNTVTIDDVGGLPERPHRYPKKYINSNNSTKIESFEDYVIIIIESTCFQRLFNPVALIRKIILNSNSMEIEDEFRGDGEHDISTYFHFASETDLQKRVDNNWQLRSDKITGEFKIVSDEESNTTLYRGDETPLGWIVAAYGMADVSSTLSIDCKVQLPVTLKYSLVLGYD